MNDNFLLVSFAEKKCLCVGRDDVNTAREPTRSDSKRGWCVGPTAVSDCYITVPRAALFICRASLAGGATIVRVV